MHINDLPFDIVSLLLRYSVGMQAQSIITWKHSIQMLAICAKWRCIARPFVFSWLFVECYDYLDDEPYDQEILRSDSPPLHLGLISTFASVPAFMSSNTQAISFADSPPPSSINSLQEPLWKSNADFILSFGSPRMVKKISLYLDYPLHILHFLNKSRSILQLDKTKWPGVTYLSCEIYSVVSEVNDDVFDDDTDDVLCASAQHAASMISQSMQNVHKLNLDCHVSHSNNVVARSFATKLINMYAGQLDHLRCVIPFKFTTPSISGKLNYLAMSADGDDALGYAKIPTEMLREIHISSAPLCFPWNVWLNDDSSPISRRVEVLNFANLESFAMQFNSPRTRSLEVEDPLVEMFNSSTVYSEEFWRDRVVAPKLKEIHLEYCPPGCPIFFMKNVSRLLKNIYIAGPIYLMDQVKYLDIDSVDTLYILLDSILATDSDLFYRATNYLFGKLTINKSASFSIYNKLPFTMESDKLCWDNLTSLGLHAAAKLSYIIAMLEGLPYLQEISVSEFTFEDVMLYVGHVDSPQWKSLLTMPLKSNIRKMEIQGNFQHRSTRLVSNIIYMLVQRIERLEHLFLGSTRFLSTLKLLLKHSKNPHPHFVEVHYDE